MPRRIVLLSVCCAIALLASTVTAIPPDGPGAGRPTAPWPPAKKPIRLLIDADAANEIDDQYALALALGFRDILKIEGIVAAHFGRGPKTIEDSFAEAERVLDKAGLKGKIPLARGVDKLTSRTDLPNSDGIELIIERAKAGTPDDPLWLVLLGPSTDGVVALLKEPAIADRLILFWHVRSQWPHKCQNFNAKNDPNASQWIFDIPSRLVMFDTGTHLYLDDAEAERRYGPIGPLGRYLATIHKQKFPGKPKGIFDLGDIAALIDPDCVRSERIDAPAVNNNLLYDFSLRNGQVVRIFQVDQKRSFDLLEEALRTIERKAP